MTTKSVKQKGSICDCKNMVKKEYSLNNSISYHYYQCERCGRVEYPLKEAQKLFEYSKNNQFLFISDWIMIWLYVGGDAPVSGITKFQKELFIILHEFVQEESIPTENPGFKAYKFGPYTECIDRNLAALMDIDLIRSEGRINTSKERFFITDSGKDVAKETINKLTATQQEKLIKLKRDLIQFDVDGVTRYVYNKYPDYINNSAIFERILHRKRRK